MGTIFELSLPEWAVFDDADNRAHAVAARLHEIVGALPDAGEDTRAKLLKEQAALAAEALTLPATVGEAARRYCLAHLAVMADRYVELDAEYQALTVKMDALVARAAGIRKAQTDNVAHNLYNHEAMATEAKRIGAEAGAHDLEAKPVEARWYAAKFGRDSQTAKARMLYGVEHLLNRNDWPRAAHVFGEIRRRHSDHVLAWRF